MVSINNSPQVPPTNDIFANAALEACHCLQPIAEKVKHLKESEQSKQTLEKKKTAAEIDAMQPQIQKCSDELSLKYPSLDKPINKKRIIDALLSQCPDASILLSNLPNTK